MVNIFYTLSLMHCIVKPALIPCQFPSHHLPLHHHAPAQSIPPVRCVTPCDSYRCYLLDAGPQFVLWKDFGGVKLALSTPSCYHTPLR